MLAGDADRERAVNVLKDAFTEGRLRQGEYEERIGRAYAARTYSELDELTADIPRSGPAQPYPVPATFKPLPRPMPPYPQPYPYGYPPPPKTNGAAVGALVCSLVGGFSFGLGSVGAVVLGHVAKKQIKERGDQGDGMATGGLVIGYLGVAFWILFWVLSAVGG
ncbi:DUF1707 and DUF4190 domain-containing protein [Actinacidiphila alni]|uniref:DUF1707 and DUF4190 domain-containing protein n=1 Tax=Actinacidiphila alni TaxID=380248 RepID=UPI003451DC84